MNPPAHPATRSHGSASIPLIEESEHIPMDRPGRLAPKWLEDLLSGHLTDAVPLILDVGCVNDQDRRALCPSSSCTRHELLVKGHQTNPGDETEALSADGKSYSEVYSCVCQNCRYHFAFYVDRGSNPDGPSCGLNHNNAKDPYHHLVYTLSEDKAPSSINDKYYPFHGRSFYFCSAKQCSFSLCIEVSKPRLDRHFLNFLMDEDRIRNRLRLALENEPDRFADMGNVVPSAPLYLRIYIRDIVEGKKDMAPDGTESERKIDQRNKKFYVQFGDGPDAAELFNYLEFEEVVDGDTRSWKLPYPEITRPTRPGSRLAFYQDVKSELETFVAKESQHMKPQSAMGHIRGALDIEGYATSVNAYTDYNQIDYDLLGIKPDMHESIFWYAFSCQRQVDSAKESAFFDALQRLTRGRGNEELEMKVQSYDSMRTAQPSQPVVAISEEEDEIRRATELSLADAMAVPIPAASEDDRVNAAYNYFGLQPDQRTDEAVLEKYQSLCESFPSQKSDYRQKLLLVGRHTGSKILQDRAKDGMDLDEALKFLEVQGHSDAEYIINVAQYSANYNERDYLLVATALRVIGQSRNNSDLLNAAAMIGAQRQLNYELGGSGNTGMNLDTAPPSSLPVNFSLPAGLQNIRNTCYLNSILQYLYTVRPIHEIMEDWGRYGLEINEENLNNRRIDPGSTRLEEGEAFAGQQFVVELTQLFEQLVETKESCLKPPQRLALAALKSSKQLEDDGTKILTKDQPSTVAFDLTSTSRQGSPPPPLPERHAPPPPPVPPRNLHPATRVQVTTVSEVDHAESTSSRSSQTLVNQTDDGWQAVNQVGGGSTVTGLDGTTTTVETNELPPPYSPTAYPQETTITSTDVKMEEASVPSTAGHIQETGTGEVKIVFEPPPTRPVGQPTPPPDAQEPTVEEKISRALNDSSVSGTDQQDVEEVMGNVMGHLRAAVKATGEDEETGLQRDPITDTFFWTSVSYNRSNSHNRYSRTVTTNRCMTAYPDEGGQVISLLKALDNSFQREFITEGTTRYERFTSILRLPPILHVHIQRTTRDGGKNNTAIEIPAVLYLDRFMDSPVGSNLFERRRRAWNIQERLQSLKGPNGQPPAITFNGIAYDKATRYTNKMVQSYLKYAPEDGDGGISRGSTNKGKAVDEVMDDIDKTERDSDLADEYEIADKVPEEEEEDSESDDDFFIVSSEIKRLMDENGISLTGDEPNVEQLQQDVEMVGNASAGTDPTPSTTNSMAHNTNVKYRTADVIDNVAGMTKKEIQAGWQPNAVKVGNQLMMNQQQCTWELQQELDVQFADMHDQEYLLHAVICHAGQTGKSGHYWVWVYDFDHKIWRRYNDSVVTEEPDAAKVMNQLSTQGEPYYLAYVRAEDAAKMVSIPPRLAAIEAAEKAAEEAEAAAAAAEAEALAKEEAEMAAAIATAAEAEAQEIANREADKDALATRREAQWEAQREASRAAALEAAAQSRRLAELNNTTKDSTSPTSTATATARSSLSDDEMMVTTAPPGAVFSEDGDNQKQHFQLLELHQQRSRLEPFGAEQEEPQRNLQQQQGIPPHIQGHNEDLNRLSDYTEAMDYDQAMQIDGGPSHPSILSSPEPRPGLDTAQSWVTAREQPILSRTGSSTKPVLSRSGSAEDAGKSTEAATNGGGGGNVQQQPPARTTPTQ